MKVLALNSSMRGDGQSRTEMLLTHLVKGMREAGAEVEMVNLREKKIQYCLGCFTCSTKTPGQCAIKDDMSQELYPKWLESDLCIYGTPLFHWTVNAPMKTFIERTWPSMEPFFVQTADGRWVHPKRHETPDAVMLSVAGFAEDWIFDELSHYAHFLFGRANKLIAEIYRPGAMAMTQIAPDKLNDILNATEQAGRELVASKRVAPETLARIKQPLADPDAIARMANMFWRSCIDEGIIPKTFEKRGMMPRPQTIADYLSVMRAGFNPAGAHDVKATLQFNFTGQVEGTCFLTIENGRIEATTENGKQPDAVITAPFERWMDVVTGKVQGMQAFMDGSCRASGDFALLGKLDQWFGRH
jgi:multimeric flavodoxin WrbA/putative sterol carrier protein